MKGVPFVNRRYTKGILFFIVKMVNKRLRVGPRGAASPYKHLLCTPLPLRGGGAETAKIYVGGNVPIRFHSPISVFLLGFTLGI